jgi:ribonucleoside-diphosphate reductase alpha chain
MSSMRPNIRSSTHPAPAEVAAIAGEIWDAKYRLKRSDGTPVDVTIDDTWRRVATALAAAEHGGKKVRANWADRFHAAVGDFGFLPAGRIIAGAGSGRSVTLFNCFVMGTLPDELGAIFDSVKQAALTMQQGGGIGQDFSTLRPRGAVVASIGADASGPVSFMDVWDAMCRTVKSAGARRGAMMATMRCDHPDIFDFIAAKRDATRLRNFNLSVLVSDAFMAAVTADRPWPLVFAGKTFRTVQARELWETITRATYEYAEPGVIFIDRINADNNLGYCETIAATNPCGEQPLPPFGACLLGSINLARLVEHPFTPRAAIDTAGLEERVAIAVRMLDNAITVSNYPLPAQRKEAHDKRRIGLGVTGLADALIFCGARYGTPAAIRLAEGWMRTIERAAYLASSALAEEKGAFRLFDAPRLLARPGLRRLDEDVRGAIERSGLRNGCLTSIAPTGTISLFAGNVSSGIEPVFDFRYRRRVLQADGSLREEDVEDYAHALWRRQHGDDRAPGSAFVTANSLRPHDHLAMQAALQRHVDSSISKTINCPADMPYASFRDVYSEAYARGLKGCTTFRPNAVTGAILEPKQPEVRAEPPLADVKRAGSPTVAPVARSLANRRGEPDGRDRSGEVVHIAPPLERDPALAGYTYKLRWPASDHAMYVTVNDIERDGRRRPFEVFINTKNLEHYAWTVALTRMISAVFRRGGDVTFVVEELKAVFDPHGGHWVGGRYVPSLLAAIGEVLEQHMRRIGFWPDAVEETQSVPVAAAAQPSQQGDRLHAWGWSPPADLDASRTDGRPCPRCFQPTLVRVEGCWTCRECNYSRCG